jgi:hypothetical protein
MDNKLIKYKELELVEVSFNGSNIVAVKMKDDGKIYVGVNWVCDGIGFTEGQIKNERKRIQTDIVLKKGGRNLTLPTKGGNQQALCIELDYVPLWLAKVSITNDMINNKQDLVENLIKYQLEVKDILSNAFIGNTKGWDLQREVGKVDRNRLTSSISRNIFNAKSNIYADYTNMIYEVLFNMKANELRESRQIQKKSQLTRDYLTEQELKLVDEAETIVTALVSLGFKKNYILDQLRKKFTKQITQK